MNKTFAGKLSIGRLRLHTDWLMNESRFIRGCSFRVCAQSAFKISSSFNSLILIVPPSTSLSAFLRYSVS